MIKNFVFHMCIPCGKAFCMFKRSRSSVMVKVKYQDRFLQKVALTGHYCFTNAGFPVFVMSENFYVNVVVKTFLLCVMDEREYVFAC